MTKYFSQIVLLTVSVILLVMNIFLIVQNNQLKTSAEKPKQVTTKEGYQFSELSFQEVDGAKEKINLASGESKTLLLVFSPTCPYCKKQYPYWKEMLTNLDRKTWKVFAISSDQDTEKLKAHIKNQNIENIRIGSVPANEMQQAGMVPTPMTIAIDTNGEVKKVWTGLWTYGFDL